MSKLKNNVSQQTSNNNNTCEVAVIEEKRDQRRLKHWVIKVLVSTLSILSVFTFLAVLYSFLFKSTSVNEGVIGTFINAFVEIIKFIFAS